MAGGKSYLLRWGALAYLLYMYAKTNIKNIIVGLFSEDYPTLKDRQISRIDREFPEWLGELKSTDTDGFAFYVRPEYGSGKILLRNLDDPSKYMSSEFAGEFVEELTRNDYQTFEDLRNRLRYPGVDEVKFMGATNPGGVGHGWVRKYFVNKNTDDPEQDRFYYVHANAYDNQYISPMYLKQLESLPTQKRKAYLEGSWDVFAGQYFDEFNSNIHTCEPFIPKKENFYLMVGGLDWGRSAPFACHITGIQKKYHEGIYFHRAWTFLELYGTEKNPEEWGKLLKQRLEFYKLTLSDINWVRCDNQIFTTGLDNSKSIHLQFVDADDRYRSLLKPATKDRVGGWTNIHNWLSIAPDGEPYWIISRDCKNLIRTLPELIHDENKVEDVDSEGEDHSGDAMRYQFSHVKWIDARVGGVGQTEKKRKIPRPARMIGDRQVSINIDKFANMYKKSNVYYK